LDGFEGLQGLWTGGGWGWDFASGQIFFSVKIRARNLKKKSPPPPSNNFCVVSHNGGGVNFS
jgi:hypothetical protein